jgi:glycosyltransferase involved in cell wall biosynthesis
MGEELVVQPLVSIVTPSFQQGRWLEDNLRSVEGQSYPRIEHIVADGGSTDGSVEVLRRHDRPGLTWTSEVDEGQSDAINRAFGRSRGEIIGWLNSDDAYFGPDVVQMAVEVFRREPDVAVVYGHAVLVNADGLVLQTLWVPPFSRSLLRLHDYIIQPAAFVRRSMVGSVLVDPSYDFTMDYELFLRLARGHRFQRIDRIIAIDRHHPARKSYTMPETSRMDHARLAGSYGIADGGASRVARKTWKILSRIAGASLIPGALSEPTAFETIRDGRLALARRQLITPRARMDRSPATGGRRRG